MKISDVEIAQLMTLRKVFAYPHFSVKFIFLLYEYLARIFHELSGSSSIE